MCRVASPFQREPQRTLKTTTFGDCRKKPAARKGSTEWRKSKKPEVAPTTARHQDAAQRSRA